MKALVAVMSCALALASGSAGADPKSADQKSTHSHSISRSGHPAGAHAKASSLAPRHSGRHVYGAPIQRPILTSHPPSKKVSPQASPPP